MSKPVFSLEGQKVWVAGHSGMVGSALMRRLEQEPVADVLVASSQDLDLTNQAATEEFVASKRPTVALLAAARVGGILANRAAQGTFLYDNLMIAANCIEAARKNGVVKVVILGSSCIYPRAAPQPMREEHLLTGPLEETNEGYAIAKIAALELGKMYRRQYQIDCVSLMPTNLYGPEDNFDAESSHVLPALLSKVHIAKVRGDETVEVWGTGAPRREFLHVDDLAEATIFAVKHYSGEQHLNVGTGRDIPIAGLAQLIAEVVGWDGRFVFNAAMPDGAPRKLLDVSKLTELGWTADIPLREGITQTYRWFVDRVGSART